jgi:hypothetical protein
MKSRKHPLREPIKTKRPTDRAYLLQSPLIYLTMIILMLTMACGHPVAANIQLAVSAAPVSEQQVLVVNESAPPPGLPLLPSCANPTPDRAAACHELEQRILATTVRIEWTVAAKDDQGDGTGTPQPYGSVGHATIKEGRYLVTHNHFGEELDRLLDPQTAGLSRFSIYKANGETLFHFRAPMTAFTVTRAGEETLIFDFGENRLFELWGMASAEFKAWSSLSLEPGMEVARVDWNGETAHVEWTTIESILVEGGTPKVKLAYSIQRGSSGGGIFWNGYHIANNWLRGTAGLGASGEALPQYSIAALNTVEFETSLTELVQE